MLAFINQGAPSHRNRSAFITRSSTSAPSFCGTPQGLTLGHISFCPYILYCLYFCLLCFTFWRWLFRFWKIQLLLQLLFIQNIHLCKIFASLCLKCVMLQLWCISQQQGSVCLPNLKKNWEDLLTAYLEICSLPLCDTAYTQQYKEPKTHQ